MEFRTQGLESWLGVQNSKFRAIQFRSTVQASEFRSQKIEPAYGENQAFGRSQT